MKNLSLLIFLILTFMFGVVALNTTYAATASFGITPPSGQLTRGQNVDFTITVDTQGQSISSTSVGMIYDMEFLQYVSAAPGDAFTTVNAEAQEAGDYNFPSAGVKKAGRLIINASSPSGFSGTGTFAIVTFKLIATSAGSAELCVLYNPEITPTPNPVVPTSAPKPTALPKTGSMDQVAQGAILGFGAFLILAGGFMLVNKPLAKTVYKHKT